MRHHDRVSVVSRYTKTGDAVEDATPKNARHTKQKKVLARRSARRGAVDSISDGLAGDPNPPSDAVASYIANHHKY